MKTEFEHSVRRLSFLCHPPGIKIAWLNPWYEITTSGVKNRFFNKEVENVKSWYCEKNFAKTNAAVKLFATRSIVDVWQGSEYAPVSDSEYTRVLNMPGYTGFWICLNNFWTCLNMPKYVWMCLNLPEWLVLLPYCNLLSTWTHSDLFQCSYETRS